jgi:hypothetical protein
MRSTFHNKTFDEMLEARMAWASSKFPFLIQSVIEEIQVQIAAAKNTNKSGMFPILIVLLVVIAVGTAAYALSSRRTTPAPAVNITQDELQQEYGLRTELVAVTAAGGFVDVRIRMVNGDKAKKLLSDKKNFPSLAVGKRVILQAPEDVKSQEIKFGDDGTMFIMFPNSRGVVKPGTPVRILFGAIAVEPIDAR